MSIEIGKLKLNKVHRLQTLEKTGFAQHAIPGMNGDIIQDLGRDSVQLQLDGIFYGKTYQDDMKVLRTIYLQRKPVDFIADIVGKAYVSQVVLTHFSVNQSAQDPEQFSYCLILHEYIKPKKNKTNAANDNVNKQIKSDAKMKMKIASLPDDLSLGSLPDITNPFTPLDNALSPVKEAATGFHDSMTALKDLLS